MPRQPNYYRILDVPLSADQAQIQHAYRALAKRYHPDRVPRERGKWAREQMARINAAYEVLGNPTRRATYDLQQGYTCPGNTSTACDRRVQADQSRRDRTVRHVAWRRERRRREQMSGRRVRVLGSAVGLGALLLGALYWWRKLAPGTPGQRWMWGLLLLAGLGLVGIVLGRAVR